VEQFTALNFKAQAQGLSLRPGRTSEDPDLLGALLLTNWYGRNVTRSAQLLHWLEALLTYYLQLLDDGQPVMLFRLLNLTPLGALVGLIPSQHPQNQEPLSLKAR